MTEILNTNIILDNESNANNTPKEEINIPSSTISVNPTLATPSIESLPLTETTNIPSFSIDNIKLNTTEQTQEPKEELIVIKYTDYYGVTHHIEVTKEFAEKYYGIIKDEKRIERKETRRHISLETLAQKGIDFPSSSPDPIDTIIQQERIREARKLIASLSPSQQKLIRQLFYQNLSFPQIAALEGVTPSAIRHRWGRIREKAIKYQNSQYL